MTESRADKIRRRKGHQSAPGDASSVLWNTLSILALVGIGILGVVIFSIFSDPSSPYNPFPPVKAALQPTLFIPAAAPTNEPATETPAVAQVTTPEVMLTPSEVPPTPTLTPSPTETPTPGPSPTSTIHSAYPYIVDTTLVLSSDTFHSGEGCKLWLGGQAVGLRRDPTVGITVQLGGYLGKTISQFSLTGTALQYGPAGYEFTILDETRPSKQALWVQLLDQTGVPLSARVFFDTEEDCQKNLILINFRQVR
jgi:hypothetical protein